MTRFFKIVTFCFCIALFVACGNKKQKEASIHNDTLVPEMVLSKYDTTQVMNLTKKFLNTLKANKTEAALGMLYYYNEKGVVEPLPDSMKEAQRLIFNQFPVLSYKIDNIIFNREDDSQVKYTIEFFKRKPGDNRPNTISFVIKPIRQNNVWYLTMYDTNTNNADPSKIEN